MAKLVVEYPNGYGLASIMARKGADRVVIGAALERILPIGPQWSGDKSLAIIGTGPGTWLAYRETADPLWAGDLGHRLQGLASVSDQSSAYTVVRLSGPDARRLLQRGAAIDLDPSVFAAGSVAITVISHIGVIIRQIDDSPTYDVATFRSYAQSFRHWVEITSAAL